MPSPAFDVQRSNNATTLAIRGSLDINTAPQLGDEVDRIIAEKPNAVVVDLSGLDLIDSSGVGALVSLLKRVRGYGGEVRVAGVRDQPLAIFKLLQLHRVFPGLPGA